MKPVLNQPRKHSWLDWILIAAALVLGLVALLVVFEDLSGRNPSSSLATTLFNLATGLCSLGGGIGFALHKRWGAAVFGISVLGHICAHGLLLASLFSQNRASIFSIGGLAAIPLLAAAIWVAMRWRRQKE